MGQSPKSSAYNSEGVGLPFLQGRTTFGDKYPFFDTWTTEWNKEAKQGDILFTVRAPVGDLNIATTTIAIGRGIAAIHPTKVETTYLFYLLQANKHNFLSSSAGTIFDSINKDALESIQINIHDEKIQRHIVNTIGSVDDLIEKYQAQISKICSLLELSLSQYGQEVEIEHYHPKIIKSGISEFKGDKEYIDTSSIEGVNNLFSGESITYDKRPSRANMEPLPNSVWFAKMKDSKKKLILTEEDTDIIESNILSTGFQGIEATKEFPLSLIAAIVISDNFDIQRDINSVGTTMAGINNETFLKIKVPLLSSEEIKAYDSKYAKFIGLLSLKRKQIIKLKTIKQQLLQKYF